MENVTYDKEIYHRRPSSRPWWTRASPNTFRQGAIRHRWRI